MCSQDGDRRGNGFAQGNIGGLLPFYYYEWTILILLQDSAKIVVWPKKGQNFDNQLWMYDSGYIINKNSGLGRIAEWLYE